MVRTIRRTLAIVAITGTLLAIAIGVVLRNSDGDLPYPNAYDDFVKAGQMASEPLDSEGRFADYRELTFQDLQLCAATNAAALQITRDALERPSRIPIQSNAEWFGNQIRELATFKTLSRVFLLHARLALLEARTNDAVNLYLDSIRFAHECNRGGMVLHTSIARTQEALGLEGLKAVASTLDANQCRRIANTLEELDEKQEPWGNYSRRDTRYTLRAETRSLFSLDKWRRQQNFRTRFLQSKLLRRQRILAYAARAYELETGSSPTNAATLVPAYLKKVPEDPTSGRQLFLAANQSPR